MQNNVDLEKETWHIINNYFKTNINYFTLHHLNSYENCLEERIKSIINHSNPLINIKEKIEGSKDEYKYKLELYIGGINGDEISIVIEGIGTLTNPVQNE